MHAASPGNFITVYEMKIITVNVVTVCSKTTSEYISRLSSNKIKLRVFLESIV